MIIIRLISILPVFISRNILGSKSVFMNAINWLKESNRMSHLWMGFSIWLVLMLLSVGCLSCFDALIGLSNMQGMAITITCAVICDASVFTAMCAIEYIQKASGIGKWDWLDIAAGVIIPIILTIVIIAF